MTRVRTDGRLRASAVLASPVAVAVAIALTATLAACGGSSKPSASSSAPTTVSSATTSAAPVLPGPTVALTTAAPATTSVATTAVPAGAPLTKVQFLAMMNNVCTTAATARKQLQPPTSNTDYATIIRYFSGLRSLLTPYLSQADKLVSRSADQKQLRAQWLSIESGDFTKARPIIDEVLVASQAQNGTRVGQLLDQLNALPNHTPAIARFMNSYGLTECGEFESG